jgi:hypothetical protein
MASDDVASNTSRPCQVVMADGSRKAIEDVNEGDAVLTGGAGAASGVVSKAGRCRLTV